MPGRITIIQGHPDAEESHYCHALAEAYARGALASGHEVRRIDVSRLNFPIVRSQKEFVEGTLGGDIKDAQETIRWASHLVIFYPLWLGTMPALLKGFFEQVFRYGFAIDAEGKGWPKGLLRGRSARVVVTMGMPAFAYRWLFGAHGLRSLERSILRLSGITPIRESLIGLVDAMSDEKRKKWLERMEALGRSGR